MSTTIIPDIYRHTARKSTVSRNIKAPTINLSLSNNNNNSKEKQLIYNTIQCDIKLEKDILHEEQQQISKSFTILPENEIEQMNIEQTNEEIIHDIIEQIKNQIPEYFIDQVLNIFNPKRFTLTVFFIVNRYKDELFQQILIIYLIQFLIILIQQLMMFQWKIIPMK